VTEISSAKAGSMMPEAILFADEWSLEFVITPGFVPSQTFVSDQCGP